MASLNLILTLNTERYAQIKTIIQCKSQTVCFVEVPNWSVAAGIQRDQESDDEQRQWRSPHPA